MRAYDTDLLLLRFAARYSDCPIPWNWYCAFTLDNLDLIAGSVSSLWVMLSSYLIAVPAFIFFFSVSGTGNTQTALLIDMASIFVYVLYALWVGIRMHADVAVCWTTEHVYDLMILSAFFYLWKGNWQNKKL